MTETKSKQAIPLSAIPLPDRVVVSLSGPATPGFLQGLVTVDVEALSPSDAGHGALLTPQGKLQFDFLIVRTTEDSYLMDVPRSFAANFMKRLMFYRLRAEVEIRHAVQLAVVSLPEGGSENLPDGSHSFIDPRHEAIGHRAFVTTTPPEEMLRQAGYAISSDDAYHAVRIAAGIPEAPHDFEYGALFPHDIALDQTGGIDFHKGCFVGQEVVSRMQHRGTARRRPVHVGIDGTAPERGDVLHLAGKSVGEMGSHEGMQGLAILRLDRAADALSGAALEAGATGLSVRLPTWSDYAIAKDTNASESAA